MISVIDLGFSKSVVNRLVPLENAIKTGKLDTLDVDATHKTAGKGFILHYSIPVQISFKQQTLMP